MRKIFTLLLSLVLLPLVAWGQEITGNWKDQISEAVAEKDYQVVGNTYNVYSAVGLAWVAEQINDKDDYVISLRKDIDLSGYYWTPIEILSGSFNGNGHKISNMSIKIDENSTSSVGLIGTFEESYSRSVHNIILENVSISGKPSNQINVGALIGSMSGGGGTVDNCHVSGKMEIEIEENKVFRCGGLVGYGGNSNDKVTKCSSDIDMEITRSKTGSNDCYVGGLIGNPGGIQIYNCESKGNIVFDLTLTGNNADKDCVGGLIGYTDSSPHIINCMTSGSISLTQNCNTYTNQYTSIGGLIGGIKNTSNFSDKNMSVTNCASQVTITKTITPEGANTDNLYIGSFVGSLSTQSKNISLTADNCYYTANEGIEAVGHHDKSDETTTYGELSAITTDTDLVSAMNEWVAAYDGEEELLTWDEDGLVMPVIAVEGTDYAWSEDNKTCTIKTVIGLVWFSEQVYKGTAFEGQTVKLAEGTWDLSDYEWIPIGCTYNSTVFKGTFDGNFQTVKLGKFSSKEEHEGNVGFFGCVEGGTIQNLIVEANFTVDEAVAIVVNKMEEGTIDHVMSKGSALSTSSVSGIVRSAENVTIKNCINMAELTGSGYVGGISCSTSDGTTLKNCYNAGKLSGRTVGALCSDSRMTLEGCAYLEGTAEHAGDDGFGSIVDIPAPNTQAEFADGTVTKILGEAFGQRIGEDKYPVWMAAISEAEQENYKVYSVTFQDKDGNVLKEVCGNKGDVIDLPLPEEGKTYTWYDAEGNPFTDTSVTLGDDDVILSCEITINTYSVMLTAEPTEGGHFLVNDAEYDASQEYNYGTEITIEAVPEEGYLFKGWADGETEVKRTETVKSVITLTANFEKEPDPEPEEPETPDTPVIPDYPDYYNIYVDECEGVTVETSTNVVREGNSMSFTIEVAEGYTAEDMVVKVKRSLFGYTDIIEPNEEGKYEIRNIWTEIYITVEGVEKETPTGIEEITESKVYAKDGSLYVQTPKQEQVVIISISGAVIKNETQIGLKRYDLPRGIYIICIGEERVKVRN